MGTKLHTLLVQVCRRTEIRRLNRSCSLGFNFHWPNLWSCAMPAPVPLPLYLSTDHWPTSCAFALRKRCARSPSPSGRPRSTTHCPGIQHNEVNDRPPGHRMHYIGSRRPRPFTIRQGCCSMRAGVGMGTILPIPCVVWLFSLALPRLVVQFQRREPV